MIRRAGSEQGGPGPEAMNGFVRYYWKPIFYFLRMRGFPVERAEDLTQEFLLRLMEREWLRSADEERGRFRNFILRVLMRFVSDQGPARATRQKGFEGRLVAVSSLVGDEERSFEPMAGLTAEELFERRWAVSLVQSVRDLLQASFALEGKGNWYEVFVARYFTDPTRGRTSESALAAQFGMTREQIRHALRQTKLRFLQLLQAEVRGQMGDEDLNEAVREILELAARHVPAR